MTSRTTVGAVLMAGLLAGPGTSLGAQKGPAAAASKLPVDVLGLACAPRASFTEPDSALRVTGGQDSFIRVSYSPGDLVTINAGRQHGIKAGQEYYTRRLLVPERKHVARDAPATIMTTGWIKVYAVDDRLSLATITHACNTIEVGDFLEPFALPTVPAASADKPKPERDNYGHVLTGDDLRTSFGHGDYILIDRGSDHGVTLGMQFELYHNKEEADNFLYDLGEAVAVDVMPESSTLKVTVSRDAIETGDLVAMRRVVPKKPDAN